MEEILLYPWGEYYLENKIFFNKNFLNLCKVEKNPFMIIKENLENKNINFVTIDKGNLEEAKYIIFFDVPNKNNKYFNKCLEKNLMDKLILFLWEPEVVNPNNYNKEIHKYFKYIFTWNDDLIDNIKYFKFNYPEPYKLKNPYEKTYKEKELCTLISGNKSSKISGELYSERIKTIEFFEKNDSKNFNFYGRGWNKHKNRLEKLLPFIITNYSTYKGETSNKMETLSNYKFCICYENQKNVNGYITEKIFDCFLSGCIPIYWGAENISQYVPEKCFIDRRKFKTNDELYNFIIGINEEEYNSYIKSIKEFLNSEKYYQFTDEFFAKNIVNMLTK